MSTLKAGEAVNVLHVNADEPIDATGRAVVLVVDRPKPRESVPAATRPLPVTQPSPGTCSCQNTVTIPFTSGSFYPQ